MGLLTMDYLASLRKLGKASPPRLPSRLIMPLHSSIITIMMMNNNTNIISIIMILISISISNIVMTNVTMMIVTIYVCASTPCGCSD